MVSNPLFIIPDFFYIFQMNFAMATLGLKEMGKFHWEGTLISLINVEVGINVEGVQKLPNH